jgi:hypothetical protein
MLPKSKAFSEVKQVDEPRGLASYAIANKLELSAT